MATPFLFLLALCAPALAGSNRVLSPVLKADIGVRVLAESLDIALQRPASASSLELEGPRLPSAAVPHGLPGLDDIPKVAAFLERIGRAGPEVRPAQRPLPSAAEAYGALAAANVVLEGVPPEEIPALTDEAVLALVRRVWEGTQAGLAFAPPDGPPAFGPPSRGARPPAPALEGPQRYDKLFVALKYYLLGKGYHKALEALYFAKQHHTGKRKDGVTPEFQHQIEIALFLTTLKGVRDEETVLAAAMLHDVMEDYDVGRDEMERRFGSELTRVVWLLTKTHRGVKKDPAEYFAAIAADPVASLVKGADRIHNVQSMVGVFGAKKQREYIAEVERWFLPMIKAAKYNFPDQSPAYFNIQHMLKSQLELLKARLASRARRPKP